MGRDREISTTSGSERYATSDERSRKSGLAR